MYPTYLKQPTMKFPNDYEFRESYFRQCFSIPELIIFYAAKNPSSAKVYQKLIQTCKYFFIKNPIIIFHCLNFEENQWKTCVNQSCLRTENRKYCNLNFDIQKLQSKICVSNDLIVSSSNSSLASSLLPKMYNGNIMFLELWEQKISFSDLLFLSKEVETLNFCESTVFYENGTFVPYEVIVANLPKLQNLHIDHSDASYNFSKTVIELLKIPHFKNLQRFSFHELNDTFDIEKFFAYLKNFNQTRTNLKFFDSISEEYREKLQNIVDEILDGNPFRLYVPPFIAFDEQLRQNELYDKCEKYF